MSDPRKPDRRLQSAEIEQQAARRETQRPSDSTPVFAGQFATLPATFGRYQVQKLLGRGAMGAVYLARDTQLDRLVALKIPKVAAAGSKRLLLRLETEAKAAARLDHPSLCKVFDAGEVASQCFIAMQFIEGETLKAQLDTKSKSIAESIALVVQLAEGLTEAHALGIIHRDLKPENIMINLRGTPVIMDFGLAKFSTISSNAAATQAGTILGSPAYMSPEQASGNLKEIDQRSDIYSLGIIFFELLTGEWPFTGSALQILGQKSIQDPVSPLNLKPDLPPQVAAVCHKMITRNNVDRYQSLTEVLADLRGLDLTDRPAVEHQQAVAKMETALKLDVGGQPPHGRRRSRPPLAVLFGGGAALVVAFLAVTLWFRTGDALVKVEVMNEDIKVTFQNDTITIDDGLQSIKAKPGQHALHVQFGDMEFDTNKFTLKKGANPTVTVKLLKSALVAKLGDQEIIRRSLAKSPGVSPTPDRALTPAAPSTTGSPPPLIASPTSDGPSGELPPETWHDILSMVKLPGHNVSGIWQRNGTTISCEEPFYPSVMVPVVVDGGYELTCEFARRTGAEAVYFALPVGVHHQTLMLSGWTGSVHGLTVLEGRDSPGLASTVEGVTRPGRLTNGKRYQLHVDVTLEGQNTSILVKLDDERVLQWTGATDRLRGHPMPCARAIGLCSFNSIVDFHSLKLRLKSGGRAIRLSDEWTNPLTAIDDTPPPEIAAECITWGNRKYYISNEPMKVGEARYLACRYKGRLLTVSSKEEELFLAAQAGTRAFWMAGRRVTHTSEWRDERNRPLRYLGEWSQGQPDIDSRMDCYLELRYDFSSPRWHNRDRNYAGSHACIEWGEEYPQARQGVEPTSDREQHSRLEPPLEVPPITLEDKKPEDGNQRPQSVPSGQAQADAEHKAGIERLRQALLNYSWYYSDSQHPPGGPLRFYRNGKFDDRWKWNYWVVGPRTMHVQFWDPKYSPKKSVVFTFNEDLTRFTAQFGKNKVTGTRLKPVQPSR